MSETVLDDLDDARGHSFPQQHRIGGHAGDELAGFEGLNVLKAGAKKPLDEARSRIEDDVFGQAPGPGKSRG
ncbi:hypothetical protein [Bowdeniella massiliensis]|uniref:hypothetical protein n=1 Tax=Bowdeniella massiliensis TaxID=2932264 RepID=UPI002027CBDB|nr:hypothetical protein [Bowdeniella massiliensis]